MIGSSATVGKKIGVGFGLVIVMLIVAGLAAYIGVNGIVGNAKQVIEGNKLDALLAQKEVDHLNWARNVSALFIDRNVSSLKVETDDHKCGFGKWLYSEERKDAEKQMPNLAPLLKEIEESHRKLHESATAIGQTFCSVDRSMGALLREKKVGHLTWLNRLGDSLIDPSADKISVEIDPTKCSLGKWLASKDVEELKKSDPEFAVALEAVVAPHKELHQGADKIGAMLAKGEREEARLYFTQQVEPAVTRTLKAIDGLIAWHDARLQRADAAFSIYSDSTVPALQTVQETLKKIREEAKRSTLSDEVMLRLATLTKRNIAIVLGLAIPLALLLSILITRGITGSLRRMSNQMSEAAGEVASASHQISSASQQLAEGASLQASALEETAASLEEMASMTTQSAGNARQANILMAETRAIVVEANESMGQLTASMDEISKASEETSKIIKTIDEIAFQTNLLALNAAVEAARAGEAGAGFAVVADEVRNLAMRAAEAAKNTESLIEGTVKRIHDGSELVRKTNTEFSRIATTSGKMAELVDEMAQAANEQAQGIDQITSAVSEMDTVTQKNSSSAEESAAASEEMSGQADQMQSFVHCLAALIGGNGSLGPNSRKKCISRMVPRFRETIASASTAKIPHRAQTGNGKTNGKHSEQSADLADPHDGALRAGTEMEHF
jgi:methyl-accepting chemotaxis protein